MTPTCNCGRPCVPGSHQCPACAAEDVWAFKLTERTPRRTMHGPVTRRVTMDDYDKRHDLGRRLGIR